MSIYIICIYKPTSVKKKAHFCVVFNGPPTGMCRRCRFSDVCGNRPRVGPRAVVLVCRLAPCKPKVPPSLAVLRKGISVCFSLNAKTHSASFVSTKAAAARSAITFSTM